MTRHSYWFPAKRRGWGWGPPTVWQGWVVLCVWMGATTFGFMVLAPGHLLAHCAFIVLMLGTLMMVCFAKGEPPSWRWGGSEGKQ